MDLIRQLYASAGGRGFSARLAAIDEGADDVADALFASFTAKPGDLTVGDGLTDGRDIHSDLEAIHVHAAQRWPDRYLRHVQSSTDPTSDSTMLRALSWVDRPEARDILIIAVKRREAGQEWDRGQALDSLIALDDARLPDLLVALVKDRSTMVRFSAVGAAIEFGDSRLLPSLRRIVEAERTRAGTREYAWDAIEAIATRWGLTDVTPHPNGRRLVAIPRPRGVVTVEAVRPYGQSDVIAGDELARLRVDQQPVIITAPRHGHIVTTGVECGRPPRAILFHLRTY